MDTKTRPLYTLSTRDPPQTGGCMQTESEGWKRYPMQMDIKAGVAIHISDIKYFNIKTAIRDNRTQHKDQGINPRRSHNSYKYIGTQHRSISIHKANTNNY